MTARRAWFTLTILVFAYVVAMLDRIVITLLVAPIQRDLNITDTQFGLLNGFAFALFYTIMAIPIAGLADRKSRRLIIGIGILLWSMFTGACGLARNVLQLFIARTGVGIGEASLAPAGVSLIASTFPAKYLGRALAIFQSGAVLGTGLAYLMGGWVLRFASQAQTGNFARSHHIVDWQIVFFVVALPGLAIAALSGLIVEPRRELVPDEAINQANVFSRLWSAGGSVVPYMLAFSTTQLISFAFIGWMPTLFVRKYHLDVTVGASILGAVFLVVAPAGMVIGGLLNDLLFSRGRRDAPIMVAGAGCLGMLLFGTLAPLPTQLWATVVLFALLFFFGSMSSGIANTGVQMLVPADLRARATAVFYLVINLIGMAGGPLITALITDRVFGSRDHLDGSLSIVALIFGVLGVPLFYLTAGKFARDIARPGGVG
jgi:MFS family permease